MTRTIDAVGVERAGDLRAAWGACAFTTELATGADDSGAGISLAVALGTPLTGRATRLVARLPHTEPTAADLTRAAANADARVNADAVLAAEVHRADEGLTRLDTGTLEADEAFERALIPVAGARAGAPDAELPSGANRAVVNEAVAIVVDEVAGLSRQVPADPAGVSQALVDSAVAVFVGGIAGLNYGAGFSEAGHPTGEAGPSTRRASARITRGTDATARELALIDVAVAVIVPPVAELVHRGQVLHAREATSGADEASG